MLKGLTWHSICEQIISALPQQVYLTIDIDGLDPSLCPNTGTPVPGGLSYEQLIYLLKQLALSDKTIIGMDLVEVGNDAWDANVAARILYNMIGYWELNLR
jgi:agmatinase